MQLLLTAAWKGNIRELENVLERAIILGNGEWISPEDLPGGDASEWDTRPAVSHNLKTALRAYEKSHIEQVLTEAGDRGHAAQLLGISRSSLYRKMEQLGIPLN